MPIIQSLDRALHILDLFDEYTVELKITDISERMQLHKSTVHSLLKTLEKHGYIEQNKENGKYRLGMKLVERGNLILQSLDIRTRARSVLVDLSADTGQTTHLVVREGKEGVYIDKVEGKKAAIRYSRIGRRIPLHSSAVGKVLVAFHPLEEIDRIMEGYEFFQQTPQTITGKEEFLKEMKRVREQGYAVDNQENEPGVRCVAAPIFDHSGRVAAALSISTLISSVDDEELMSLKDRLKRAVASLSQSLGYRGTA